ncbi:Rbd2 protein [Candida orthopsilosis Co 90-125]|uniref:Rhomboid-type serine protease 2 n=1 Tax=Candida orthopsilosis (strain 90-125) TaxID=1136231 RepID=H8XA14_CANO9|nr:Rbd2 protein [Candida orthopsilosis Co 90-125]CCG24991.1 Rbd2 protein [Candida orthopsilosis Co 90-125]
MKCGDNVLCQKVTRDIVLYWSTKHVRKKFTQMYLLYTDYLQLYTSRDSDNPMEQSPINTFPPSLGTLKQIPALTAGLPIFTFILCFLKNTLGFKFSSLILYPTSPLEFNLNALSLYSLIHVGYLHWLLNICAIFTPLAMYEKRHGTVYTGITLNLLTVIAALQYCIVGLFFYPETGVVGLSGVGFSFIAYMAYKEHQYKPVLETFNIGSREIKIYTLAAPFIAAVVCLIVFPASSLPGHLAGISTGFLLAKGYINKLFPPSSIILKIENFVAPGIALIDQIVSYHKEEDAVHVRSVQYAPILAEGDAEASSATTSVVQPQPTRSSSYIRETHVLGGA